MDRSGLNALKLRLERFRLKCVLLNHLIEKSLVFSPALKRKWKDLIAYLMSTFVDCNIGSEVPNVPGVKISVKSITSVVAKEG